MSKLLDLGVWKQTGNDTISRHVYFGILGGTLTWGFLLTFLISSYTSVTSFNIWGVLGLGLIVPLIGIFISAKSNNAWISFLGFNLVVGGLSAVIGPVLHAYEIANEGVVQYAAGLTGAITLLMMLAGVTYPKIFERLGRVLFFSLLAYVLVSLISLFWGGIDSTLWAYLGAGIFTLYIGYDMYRATTIPATADNAVDVAVSLYLDIINLFLKILQILGNRK